MPGHVCTETERLKRIEERLVALDKSIRGNGQPGLMTQMAVMKVTIGGIVVLNGAIITKIVNDWIK